MNAYRNAGDTALAFAIQLGNGFFFRFLCAVLGQNNAYLSVLSLHKRKLYAFLSEAFVPVFTAFTGIFLAENACLPHSASLKRNLPGRNTAPEPCLENRPVFCYDIG
ncbi:MAG TPA: hypothetical protein PLR57_05800 [Clostridia bacterium]|nr:hypothetical protein [Clostridia bacterium]